MLKIGLIESDSKARTDLKNALEESEYCELQFTLPDGRGAVEAIMTHPLDALILGDENAYFDGVDILESIRHRIDPMPYIIFTTFQKDSGYLFHIRALGVSCIMIKPIQSIQIVRRLGLLKDGRVGKGDYPEELNDALSLNESVHEEETIYPERMIRRAAVKFLQDCGMSSSRRGFEYLCASAVVMQGIDHSGFAITKDVYPTVGRMCQTSGSVVEAGIRQSILQAWDGMSDASEGENMFRFFSSRPKNSEFLLVMRYEITQILKGEN